ncbi:hypothetical protein RFI_22954, partial [Reticulomyxa filosa]
FECLKVRNVLGTKRKKRDYPFCSVIKFIFLKTIKSAMSERKKNWRGNKEKKWLEEDIEEEEEEGFAEDLAEGDKYLAIRPEGPITGAVWENGKWIHVGQKRKRFKSKHEDENNDEYLDPHTNVVTNPRKKQKFLMKVEQAEIEKLSREVKRKKPPRDVNPLLQLKGEGEYKLAEKFEELNISEYTKYMLKENKWTYMTDIQKLCIPHGLVGRDILGAAKTGSGKTLSFVIPLIENLYRKAWHVELGLGALVLAPTRELALQIFETIRMVGKRMRHLSIGLIIGGQHSKMEEEKNLIGRMTILVATPGRLLSHLEQSFELNANHLQILILDEADVMFDVGLFNQVQTILEYLPKKRQTMLFSATLTMDILHLANLSLRRPILIPLDAPNSQALPTQLMQTYIQIPLEQKLNLLWSFMQTHINDKILVFFATLRQVKFARRVFNKLRPFSSLLALHSEMKQFKRMAMYQKFKIAKHRTVLFATEIAARGLDFPNVDWVINFDVPSHIHSYIHRVGRAARLTQKGNCITFLIPQEMPFIQELQKFNISVRKLGIHTQQLKSITPQIRTLLATDDKMLQLAKKSFFSFLKSYYRLASSNPLYIRPDLLDKDLLAQMFGLMHTPNFSHIVSKYTKSSEFDQPKKINSLKDNSIPQDLKMLLLDTKKKQRQSQKLKSLTLASSSINPNNPQLLTPLDQRLSDAAKNTALNMPSHSLPLQRDTRIAKSQLAMLVPDVEDHPKSNVNPPPSSSSKPDISEWLEQDLNDFLDDIDDNADDDYTNTNTKNNEDILEQSALQAILNR